MPKRLFMCMVVLLGANHASHAMETTQLEAPKVEQASVISWLFALNIFSQAPKEYKQAPASALPRIPSQQEMPYMTEAEQQNSRPPVRVRTSEESKAYAQAVCERMYFDYPGGPVRSISPVPTESTSENQRCLLKISCGTGSCCP